MQEYISNSDTETKKIAAKLAREGQGKIFALSVQLGAGKTIFAQGFAKGLGIKEKIISPTFVLIRQHQIPNTTKTLYHIDLYRLENLTDINQLGLKEIFSNPNNIILIEWADKLTKLPEKTIRISIQKEDSNKRCITIYDA